MHDWATITRRVSLATIAICCAILGVGATICILLYRTYELVELDLLLAQDMLIESGRITLNGKQTKLSGPVGRGLYDVAGENWLWQLTQDQGDGPPRILLQSPSLGPVNEDSQILAIPNEGKGNFESPEGGVVRGLSQGFPGTNPEDGITFRIAAPMKRVTEEIDHAVRLIALIFIGLALMVSIAVYSTVNRGLKPLKRLSESVKSMRQNDAIIDGRNWPPDLIPVVEELRALHRRNNMNLEKTRRKNAELAHGLKTPLAALIRVAENLNGDKRDQVADLVDRMTRVIKRNLSRARTERPYGKSSPVRSSAEDVVYALGVIFRDRMPEIENNIDEGTLFLGEVADIQEILGNLLENACYWAETRVHISAPINGKGMIALSVEDNGPGMERSQTMPKSPSHGAGGEGENEHGLGLLIVQDIAELYGGSVHTGKSSLGGARVTVMLPGRIAE